MLNPLSRTTQSASPETLAALRGVGKHPEEEARDVSMHRVATVRGGVLNLVEVTRIFPAESNDEPHESLNQADYYQEAA